jgi:hypothetical protein
VSRKGNASTDGHRRYSMKLMRLGSFDNGCKS